VSEKIQKQSYDFRKAIDDFSLKIVQVKSVKDLIELTFGLIESKIFATSVSLLLKDLNDNKFRIYHSGNYREHGEVEIEFHYTSGIPELLEKDQVEVNPAYFNEREKLLSLFREVNAEIIIPLLFDSMFIGSINIGRKREGKYKRIEVQFLEQMVNSINIAFSNSLLLNRIEELNLSLEKKVGERTFQLQEANNKLRELDRLKSDFFANISHEIRTPLTLILAPVESGLLVDYDDTPDRGFFENLQRNAIILLKLINDLLDFSKIEAGQMKMRIREVDIVSFISSYASSFKSAAESKGIKISFEYTCSAIPVFIDTEKMDKIVMNLFSNALKFTDKGGFIKITVSEDGRNCYIQFRDSGIGIPPDKFETIFDRFSQVNTGYTRKYEGTGIGLALVKEFVELHGGAINVESRALNNSPEAHGTIMLYIKIQL
jgi:signal transduction histidine kinase